MVQTSLAAQLSQSKMIQTDVAMKQKSPRRISKGLVGNVHSYKMRSSSRTLDSDAGIERMGKYLAV